MASALVVLLLLATPLLAASQSDMAVFSAFQQGDSTLKHFAVLQRTTVTGELDVVIAAGSSKSPLGIPAPGLAWSEELKLGLFLQEKARIDRVYSLGAKFGFPDCLARIERVTAKKKKQ